MPTHVWLENEKTGGKQQFDKHAVELWKLRGWKETSPPEEPQLIRDPLPHADELPPEGAEPEVVEEAEARFAALEKARAAASDTPPVEEPPKGRRSRRTTDEDQADDKSTEE